MTDLIRIEYRDKNGDLYGNRSHSIVPRAGDFIQLNNIIYPIEEVFWIDEVVALVYGEEGIRVVVVIGKKTQRMPFKTTDNYGNR